MNQPQLSFKIIHFNTRSYQKNFTNIQVLLESLCVKFDCIILTETWMDENKPLEQLEGYDLFYTSDTWNKNDGVIVYIKTELGAFSHQIKLGEATGLRIEFYTDRRHYVVLAVYRSPTMNCYWFLNDLETYFSVPHNNSTTCLFVGDLNIDTLQSARYTYTKDLYLDILYGAGFCECIYLPTRVTENSKTCIDHIFVKHFDYTKVNSGVLITDVTDHYAITANILYSNHDASPDPDNNSTYLDKNMLRELLEAQSWDHVLAQRHVDKSCEMFFSTLNYLHNKSKLPKKQNTRDKKLKPWITIDLVRKIRKRDKLSKKLKKQPWNVNLKTFFNHFRNLVSDQIKITKINYYRQRVLDSTDSPKLFWTTIKEYSGMTIRKKPFPTLQFTQSSDTGGEGIGEVAKSFNSFFANVGKKLALELPPSCGPPLVDDSVHRARHEFTLKLVSEEQVARVVGEMRGGSAPGMDGFPTEVLKNSINHIIKPLRHIINQSIFSGVFPESLKIAKVIPIHKSSSKIDMNNYRPISLLNSLSKVLEKCVKKQFQTYLEQNNILSDHQFGFRAGKNTSDALFLLCKNIVNAINRNEKTIVLFIDIAKAFDSIDRNILFSKLNNVGVEDVTLCWFKSHLSNKTQVVSIDGYNSEPLKVDYGVVQGSTLGPLLFLIYINNLDKINLTGKLFLFADDTAIVFKGKSWAEVYETAAREVVVIKRWFDENVLTMNLDKTKCMPIALRATSEPPADLQLRFHSCGNVSGVDCGCRVIERVDQYKYLGVILDSKLRFEHHINWVKSKVRKMIYVFHQLKQILNMNEIKVVYNAYVQSVLQYGIIAWGGSFKTLIESLLVVQKRIIKTAFKLPIRHPTEQLFRETNLLSVRQLYIKTLLVYTFGHKDGIVTPTTHEYSTRSAVNVGLQVPKVLRSANFTNSFYIANCLYRNIPPEIRDLQISRCALRKRVNSWLLEVGVEGSELLIRPPYNL